MECYRSEEFLNVLSKCGCEDEVRADVLKFIKKIYRPNIVVGLANHYVALEIPEEKDNRMVKNTRYFELVIGYEKTASDESPGAGPEFSFSYQAAIELAKEDFEKRKALNDSGRIRYVNPVEMRDGIRVINLGCTESGENWLQAGRLQKLADAGDQEAARKLFIMENSLMFYLENEEEN